jgi:RHS repeat-associated protein
VTDPSGSVVSLHDYLPFREELTASRVNTYGYGLADGVSRRFTGKVRDGESGLDYFGLRYFSSAQGRWASPDKPFADQDTPDPQSWNLYSYVRNSPLRFTDADGRKCSGGADDQTGDACFTTTVHGSWVGALFSKIGSFLSGAGEEATVNTFLGLTNTIDAMRRMSYGGQISGSL